MIKKESDGAKILPFFLKRNELSLVDDCVMVNNRVVIPEKLRLEVLKVLHVGHPGMVRMKALSRGVCYWNGLDKDIEATVKSCEQCQSASKMPVKVPLEPWRPAMEPWERVHIDYAGPVNGQYLLVIVDSFSKWPEVVLTNTMTASTTLKILSESFARNGNPKTLVSDNGPQFVSDAFKAFCEARGIERMNTPPYHPSSNGQAERFVDTVKRGLKKMNGDVPLHEALQTVLSAYRRTPNVQCDGKTPSELFLGRKVRTTVDLINPSVNRVDGSSDKMQAMKRQYDLKHGTRSKKFKIGDKVFYGMKVPPNGFKWCVGTVTSKIGKVMYEVQLELRKIRAHANQLRLCEIEDPREREVVVEMPHELLTFVERNEVNETPVMDTYVSPIKLNVSQQKQAAVVQPSSEPSRPRRMRNPPKKIVMDPRKKTYSFD